MQFLTLQSLSLPEAGVLRRRRTLKNGEQKAGSREKNHAYAAHFADANTQALMQKVCGDGMYSRNIKLQWLTAGMDRTVLEVDLRTVSAYIFLIDPI
jgi:hypothetical protein